MQLLNSGKPGLAFYTNMPTPYQLDFFDALCELFELHVIYFAKIESDRQWKLSSEATGYKVTVLTGSRISGLIQKKVPSFHFSPSIKNAIDRDQSQYVVVNGTYWAPNVLIAINRNLKRGRWVAYWSEPVFPVHNKLFFKLKKLLMRTVLNKTQCILAIGRLAEASFRSYGYKRPIHQIPYNITTSKFHDSSLEREKLNILELRYKSSGQFIFLSSGSLIERKGFDTLIRAFNELGSTFNACLLIIGDGIEREELMKLASFNKNIIFLGFQEKEMIPYWFNLADAFVFASRYDGWGLVINEAVAAGKPIICSKSTGAAADLLGDQNAILLEAEDQEGFTQAMTDVATNPELRSLLIRNYQQLENKLSSESNAHRLYDICTNA